MLLSIGSQRVGHDLVVEQQQQIGLGDLSQVKALILDLTILVQGLQERGTVWENVQICDSMKP